MSKTLISFVGTGVLNHPDKDKQTTSAEVQQSRKYRTTEYRINGVSLGSHSFLASALYEHFRPDNIIFIGTAHSMWEEVYDWATKGKGSIDVYTELNEYCSKADYRSKCEIPHKDKIEKALGGNSKVVIIKYGLNEDEIKENTNTILDLDSFLGNGDELIVDITHSFRSLPLIVMNLLIYLKNVSRKGIKITNIVYGMLECHRELGYAPVVDMSYLLNIIDWISGAYAFSEFNNAYKIADLLNDEHSDADAAKRLRDFSDLMNLNHLEGIESASKSLAAIKDREYESRIPQMIVNPIINEFISRFKSAKTHSVFQVKLAGMQFEKKNYALAYLTLQEAIITYICEENGLNSSAKTDRDSVKEAIYGHNEMNFRVDATLEISYKEINKTRNSVAHAIKTGKNSSQMIKTLEKNLKVVSGIIK